MLSNTLRTISAGLADRRQHLQEERVRIAAESQRVRDQTRNTKKRQKRLLDKARNLDEEDLVELLALKRVMAEERLAKLQKTAGSADTAEERAAS